MKRLHEETWTHAGGDCVVAKDDTARATVRGADDGARTACDVARLVAAAPDMARALMAALEWDRRSRDCPEASGRHPHDEMRAALRKAGVL